MAFEWPTNNTEDDGLLFKTSPRAAVELASGASPQLTLVDTSDSTSQQTASFGTVQAGPGDDVSPPNSTTANLLNGIAVPISSSGGWSSHAPRERVYPAAMNYHIRIEQDDSLELGVAIEYENPWFSNNESMMVRVAVAKSCLHGTEELALVSTKFQEFVTNEWIDITADIDYTVTADEVVDAVLNDAHCGQTAGKATVTAKTVEVTLGPFSKRARLLLTYKAFKVYTYQAMSVDGSDIGSHRLCPLMVALPFADVDHEAGLASVSVTLEVPADTEILEINKSKDAYVHLKNQNLVKTTTIIAVTDLVRQEDDRVGYTLRWDYLPPRSCCVLAWMAFPNPPDDDFVDVGKELAQLNIQEQSIQAVVQVPSAQDASSLQVPLPGHGPVGHLFRVKVNMPKAQPRKVPCFILDLILSDKSGSTGIQSTGATMRQRFNELAEVRFLKRLESIPALVQAGVLLPEDVWMDVFLPFDHSAPTSNMSRIMFRVKDVVDSIASVVAAIRTNDTTIHSLPYIKNHVDALRSVSPGGMTDFSVGPKTIAQEYTSWESEAMSMSNNELAGRCTFVEFDTDGGHNGRGDYLDALKHLCEVCHVRNGVVTGFGSWLNQDCASKVAATLGSVPALLALQIPEAGAEGLDLIFRRSFSAWVAALRQPPPVTLKISAGSVSFPSSATSTRRSNAVEVLAVSRLEERHERLPKFGPPDISNEAYTATVLKDVPAADQLLVYVVSRLENAAKFATCLEIRSSATDSASRAHVSTGAENLVGDFIAYDWLTMLTSSKDKFERSPIMKTSLRQRLEEEVSFRFNLPSPSGMTSYLGRCKTVADRAPIDSSHQPASPPAPVTYVSSRQPEVGGFSGTRLGMPYRRQVDQFQAFGAGVQSLSSLKTYGAAAPVPFSLGIPSSQTRFAAAPTFSSASSSGAFPSSGGARGQHSTAHQVRSEKRQRSMRRGDRGGGGSLWSTDGSPGGFRSVNENDNPLWTYAILIPAGSNTPSEHGSGQELQNAIAAVRLACQRLVFDPSINYFCDVCRTTISELQDRFHCFDCDDFDTCFNCRDRHTLPFHRVARITPPTKSMPPASEDPLVATLLKSTEAEPLSLPKDDRTMTWSKLRVERFLLSVLHWWPLFRSMFSWYDRLPGTIPNDLAEKISHSASSGNVHELLCAVKIVMDLVTPA